MKGGIDGNWRCKRGVGSIRHRALTHLLLGKVHILSGAREKKLSGKLFDLYPVRTSSCTVRSGPVAKLFARAADNTQGKEYKAFANWSRDWIAAFNRSSVE